ncbi:MAG: phage portal protein family [Rickettsiaceae bacterium]|jgi:HK97 family phage portal protein|nr:phage portal protein family [Rickettsiaceae bacterium]
MTNSYKKNLSLGQKLKKIFSRKRKTKSDEYYNARFSASGYSSFLNTPGKPVWTGREYYKFADEGYIKNVIAHRAISMIASGAASVNWKLADERSEIKNHPLLKLLKNPNPYMGGAEFFEAIYSHRIIGGNAYIQVVRSNNGVPQELYVLRPDRVTIIAGSGGVPQAYRYTVGNVERDFPLNRLTGQSDILHFKKFHPTNDWYGLSSMEAAAYSIDQHNEASAWNQALLQNGARPSGALIVKTGEGGDGYLSEEQYLRVKAQLEECNTGSVNAGRPLLLEGGLDWKEMSISPKDMDFINTKHSAARDIALAFGVPPQLLGIPGDATYNNMAEARLSLWEQTILPMIDNMASSLNNWLVPMFDSDLHLSHNLDDISALAPRREAAWNRVKDAQFLSDAEKREMVGVR